MEEKMSINANAEIPTTHFFVYKGKQYPFNFDLFKIFSVYFDSNPPKKEGIELFDESQNISEVSMKLSIPDFINFCQARVITLTKENAPTLYKLSQKYKVPLLLNRTKEFITIHQKEVVVEILIMYQNDNSFNLEEYEEIISKDLIKYVNDERLLKLPIQTLYRIVTKFISNNSEQPPEFIEFLFRCLDHFGCGASVLFDKIDSFGSSGTILNRLLEDYSEKFDFGFVNKNTLKTVYQLENEIITREKEMKKQISDSQREVKSVSKQVCEQIELMRKQREDEVKDRKEVFDLIPKMVANEIEKLRKQHEEEMKKKDEMIANMLKQFETIHTNYKEELRKQSEYFDEKLKKMGDNIEMLMRPKISRLYQGDPKGLISLLGDDVTLSSEKENPDYKLSNLKMYNDARFYNNHGDAPSSESDSIIMFDFGSYKRVDLRSYFIRTCGDDPNGDHQKMWRIEGSNDNQSWTKLDRRLNDENLNGKFKECHFICQFGNYGSEKNLFRYIRYVQEDSWNSNTNRKYIVDISYFELYGNVVTIQ